MRERVIDILKRIKPGVDYDSVDSLVTSNVLSSMNILMLVTELEEEFDVEIGVNLIVSKNFDNIDAIVSLMERLQDE